MVAWNPSPKIAAARDFGKKHKKHMVAIVAINFEDNTVEVTTYGETVQLCKCAALMGKPLHDAAYKWWEEMNKKHGAGE